MPKYKAAAISGMLLLCTTLPVAAQSTSQALKERCIDITGKWSSGSYEALSVQAAGAARVLKNLSMVLEVTQQHGCHFSGVNRWSNGEIGGEEPVLGVLNPVGNWITIMEYEQHPEHGTSGRIFGRLTDSNHINWEYAAYSSDSARANVFSTILSRGDLPPVQENCPDLTGTWKSQAYNLVELAGGEVNIRPGPQGSLTIERQSACHFDGSILWQDGDVAETERVAGVLHTDGKLITVLGVGEHADKGTRAYVHAEIVGPSLLRWDFVGISDDKAKGQAFATNFARGGAASAHQTCPVLIGKWSTGKWDGLEATERGMVERVSRDYKELQIEGQSGCTVWGKMHYGPRQNEAQGHADRIIGTVSGKDGLLISRSVAPHPEDGYEAIAVSRIQSENHMTTEYSGKLTTGGEVFVYLVDLKRKP
ncbi:MAG: hypothetical protein AAGA00_09265 [Pseudomonadota bacterium]